MARYRDRSVASELLHNDPRLQKRVRWFYRAQKSAVRRYVLKHGGEPRDVPTLMQDAMVGLFHDLKINGLPPHSLRRHFLHISEAIWRSSKTPGEERLFYYNRLHGEKAMEKLFARMEHGCEQTLKAYYFEQKTPAEISQQFGKPYERVTAEQKWPCLQKLKDLLMKDEDLLHELQANLD